MILTNAIIKYKNEKGTVKARLLFSDQRVSYLIDLGTNRMPYSINTDDLISQLDSGKAAFIADYITECAFIDENAIDDMSKKYRDKYWIILQPLLSELMVPDIFNKRVNSIMLKEAADQFDLSYQTLATKLKNYWKEGFKKNALLPDFHQYSTDNG